MPSNHISRLPLALQHMLLLEWLSPESVWTAVRASGDLRRAALSLPSSSSSSSVTFQAAEGEELGDACIRWFKEHGLRLRLWTWVETHPLLGVTHFRNGKYTRHRDDDLPAHIWPNDDIYGLPGWLRGQQEWYQFDKLHRGGDMPAVVSPWGKQEWWQNGLRHRDGDLPALVLPDGTKKWCRNGELHRDGGLPAVVEANGTRRWYLRGEHLRSLRPGEEEEEM